MSKQGSGISFCPASNLFLGSGLFKLATAKGTKTPVRVGLGTDMAGGDFFSQLQVRRAAARGRGSDDPTNAHRVTRRQKRAAGR